MVRAGDEFQQTGSTLRMTMNRTSCKKFANEMYQVSVLVDSQQICSLSMDKHAQRRTHSFQTKPSQRSGSNSRLIQNRLVRQLFLKKNVCNVRLPQLFSSVQFVDQAFTCVNCNTMPASGLCPAGKTCLAHNIRKHESPLTVSTLCIYISQITLQTWPLESPPLPACLPAQVGPQHASRCCSHRCRHVSSTPVPGRHQTQSETRFC